MSLHKYRRGIIYRGFNQAEVFASDAFSMPILIVSLEKKRRTLFGPW